MKRFFIMLCLFLISGSVVLAHEGHDPTTDVHFDQRLDEQLPLDLEFVNEAGSAVTLGDYLRDKPMILVMGYYTCENLCSVIFHQLGDSLSQLDQYQLGQDFEVVTVSIDPSETPADATTIKSEITDQYGLPSEGWHALTANYDNLQILANAVGFHYAYDEKSDQYAHPSGLVIITPQGKIARYLFGVDFPPQSIRLALTDSGQGQIGSIVDQILLLCYHYDPVTGQYTSIIMDVLRILGILTIIVMAYRIYVLLTQKPVHRGA